MAAKSVDEIIAERQKSTASSTEASDKFYSILSAEGYQENYLEIRFQDGLKTCFAYNDLTWFNYDPDEGTLDLEFSGFLVSIIGRGLGEKLFHSIKGKRAAWIKEADSDFQDNPDNEIYIDQILISPPEGFGGSEDEGGEDA